MRQANVVARGVSWVGAFRGSTRAVSFVRTIILARILSPSQFGIFGIASLAITFLEILTETGVNVVLIQKKEGIEKYLNTAWVVSIVRGLAISLILLIIARPVSEFFSSPQSLSLIYLISLVSLLRGFINPAIVKFQKELRFGQEFWFRLSIFFFDSVVAIVMSLVLKSAIGIVVGLVAGALLELIMSFVFVSPRPKFELDRLKLREVVSKGKWVTGSGLFQFTFRQGDDAVVGKILGESSLGIYQIAYKLSSLPISEVTDVFGRVTFPYYVKIKTNKAKLREAFFKTTLLISLLASVLGVILFAFGGYLIKNMLGEEWLSAVPLVKVLSIFGVVQALSNSINSLLLAVEKQHLITAISFAQIIGLFVSIFPLIHLYGLRGAVAAPLVGALVGLPFALVFLIKQLND